MNFDYYQRQAETFAVYPKDKELEYLIDGLISEIGEVAALRKREIRDGVPIAPERMAAEIGDLLWYEAMLAKHFGYTLSEIADGNLYKLNQRKQAGTIHGSGDNR